MSEGYVDLALSPSEVEETQAPLAAEAPKYPYGTSISLDEKILEKMDVDRSDWAVGDIFHLHALAKVTSISEHENQDGGKCCVTLQIIALKGESEDAEDKEDEDGEPYHRDKDTGPHLEQYGYSRHE